MNGIKHIIKATIAKRLIKMMFNVKTLNRPYNKNSALIGNTFIYF